MSDKTGWGSVYIGTRLEKTVLAEFVQDFTQLVTRGVRKGDAYGIVAGKPAQWAANQVVRDFLKSGKDSVLFVDSDAHIDADALNVLRDHEQGWQYDILSAFYTRRGWPPLAMWLTKDPHKPGYNSATVTGEVTGDVDAVGLHFCLMRRRVFEGAAEFPFYYPRDNPGMSEDVAFCIDAQARGMRMGCTSYVRTGHYSTVCWGYETHAEWQENEAKKNAN